VVSSASSKLIGGRIVANLLVSIVFPEPGTPFNAILCPPDAAISNARFTCSCPFTSLKSTSVAEAVPKSSVLSNTVGSIAISPARNSTA